MHSLPPPIMFSIGVTPANISASLRGSVGGNAFKDAVKFSRASLRCCRPSFTDKTPFAAWIAANFRRFRLVCSFMVLFFELNRKGRDEGKRC